MNSAELTSRLALAVTALPLIAWGGCLGDTESMMADTSARVHDTFGGTADVALAVDAGVDLVGGVHTRERSSFEECAARYSGFDTCCDFDPISEAWIFSDAPCAGAVQCAEKVDCPAGYVELLDGQGRCVCHSALSATCRTETLYGTSPDGACGEGRFRCPNEWPPDRYYHCSNCPCGTRDVDLPLVDPPDCPEGVEREDCPCTDTGDECCLSGGMGLFCAYGRWRELADGPCLPWSDEPFPGGCNDY